ncbi:O-antigen ligase family protein [Glaciecola petra]|uniref:O-antigen ligase family protein n=1 Tax=Glaciecola petra TaxID=3075602 RepID=A0ABU2ZLV6_9ALTE|nr:O-antigen ligase family protein [Aestuariibacter sp. P117]MDT0593609.1 O-antigen ligase family protein [Aestuariibacter sp. P117]
MLTIVLFYLTYLGGIAASLVRYPVLAFVTYQAVYFYNPNERWWSASIPALSYSFFTVVVMGLVFIFHIKSTNKNKLLQIPQFRWAYALVACFAFSYFWSPYPGGHAYAVETFVKLMIIISIAYKLCDTPQKLTWVLWGHLYGSWYIAYLAFQVGRNSGNRVQGIGTVDSPDANGIAAAIAPSIALALYFIWQSKTLWLKFAAAICAVFVANALILINSRGAILGVGVSVFYLFFVMYFSKVRSTRQKGFVILMLISGLAGGLKLADDSFIERIESMFVSKKEIDFTQESGATRFLFWKYAFDMAKDYPFGAGARAFVFYSPSYIPLDVGTGASRNRAVHSTWMEVLTEAGFIGSFCFVMMLWTTYKTLTQCEKKFKLEGDIKNYYLIIVIKACLICFMVSMTFLNRLRAEILYWMVLYSACLYNIYILKNHSEIEKPVDETKLPEPQDKASENLTFK